MSGDVTVVIPVFNSKEYILRTLLSVHSQDYERVSIVIVDDCSTDGSDRVVDEFLNLYAKRFQKITYIKNESNKGVCESRNIGIRNVVSKYLLLLDSDDLLSSNAIKNLVKELKNNAVCGAAFSTVIKIDGNDFVVSEIPEHDSYEATQVIRLCEILKNNYVTCGSGLLIDTEVLGSEIYFDNEFVQKRMLGCEDWCFYVQLALKKPFLYVAGSFTGYREHSEGSLSDDSYQMLRGYKYFKKKYSKLYAGRKIDPSASDRLFIQYLSIRLFGKRNTLGLLRILIYSVRVDLPSSWFVAKLLCKSTLPPYRNAVPAFQTVTKFPYLVSRN